MRVRALDSNHDWTFGKGQNDYLRDNSAVVQLIDTNLNSFLGDCFFDLNAGLDWFNILGSKNQLQTQLVINNTILNTDNVLTIVEVSYNLSDTRSMTVKYQVISLYSQNTSIQGAVTIGGFNA